MNTFNSIITAIFDVILYPFMLFGESTGLVLFSMFCALLIILAMPYISNQKGIKSAKDKIKAHLLEIYLYRHNMRVALRAQAKMFRYNALYVFHAFTPVLYLMVPFVIIMIQLNMRLGYEPLKVGDSAIVKVSFIDEIFEGKAELIASKNIRVETLPLWIEKDSQFLWRIRALENGSGEVTFTLNDFNIKKEVLIGEANKLSPIRSSSFLTQIFYPAEPRIKEVIISSIEISYPSKKVSFLGIHLHWLVVFFIVTILFAYIIKGFFGV